MLDMEDKVINITHITFSFPGSTLKDTGHYEPVCRPDLASRSAFWGQPIVLQIYNFIANIQKSSELHLRQSGSLASLEDYRCEQTELLALISVDQSET